MGSFIKLEAGRDDYVSYFMDGKLWSLSILGNVSDEEHFKTLHYRPGSQYKDEADCFVHVYYHRDDDEFIGFRSEHHYSPNIDTPHPCGYVECPHIQPAIDLVRKMRTEYTSKMTESGNGA